MHGAGWGLAMGLVPVAMGQVEKHARQEEQLGVTGNPLLILSTHCSPYCPHPWLFSLLSPPCHSDAHTGEGDLPPSTRIQRGETCVRITFSPTLQEQSAFSNSGIMADFTIHYDVVMEDIIGDVQVPVRRSCGVSSWAHSHSGQGRALGCIAAVLLCVPRNM